MYVVFTRCLMESKYGSSVLTGRIYFIGITVVHPFEGLLKPTKNEQQSELFSKILLSVFQTLWSAMKMSKMTFFLF